MKRIIFLTLTALPLFLFSPQDVHAQRLHREDVPAALDEAFTILHSDLKLLYWEKVGENYKAYSKDGKNRGSLLFDADANLLETQTDIELSTLPKEVTAAAEKQVQGFKIRSAGKITNSKNKTQYEVRSDDNVTMVFDSAGKFIRKEQSE